MHTLSAHRVTKSIRRGSSLPVLIESAGGTFVTKLIGAAQGSAALIAEIIVAELAEALGLPVPERVLIELSASTPSDDKNDELADLLGASRGLNLGFRWLPGAVDLSAMDLSFIDDGFRTRLLWLDGLVMNPDRTPRNPNLLLWNGQPWLIDHGASLTFQYDWSHVTESSPREPTAHELHIFGSQAPLLHVHDAALAARLSRNSVAAAVQRVPEAFLRSAFPDDDSIRLRARYQAFLWKRLKSPRPFVPVGA